MLSCDESTDTWQWLRAGTGKRLLRLPCRPSGRMHSGSGQARRNQRPSWWPAAAPSSGRRCRLGCAGLSGAAHSGTASEWFPLLADEPRWQQVLHQPPVPTFAGAACALLSSSANVHCLCIFCANLFWCRLCFAVQLETAAQDTPSKMQAQ